MSGENMINSKKLALSVALTVLTLLFPPDVYSQKDGSDQKKSAEQRVTVSTVYEPTPAYPYGRLNPAAPPETAEFSFMIGEFDCRDEILNPQTGKWAAFPAVWNARYFLNGHAIQDQYWSPAFYTSNMRIYDAGEKKWRVTFFRMPGYASGVWSGAREGKNLIMRQGTKEKGTRLTFSEITEDGFQWRGESLTAEGKATVFWKSSCRRRR